MQELKGDVVKRRHGKLLLLCLLSSILLPNRYLYSNQNQSDLTPAGEYHSALEAVNNRLLEIHETTLCPGANLAVSCGNSKCEPELGENEENCPADCVVAPVKSYNSQTFCKDVRRLFIPKSIAEVQTEVQSAIKAGLHVRVIGAAHSVNSQLCTDGIVISTQKLNHILGIEKFQGKETVLVEPGVVMGDLMDWLDEQDRSLGYPVLGYRGVTIAGAIATGAHGSSPRHSAVISDSVESIKVVGADGSIREYYEGNSDPDTFRALKSNLGMLGAVVQIRLRIMPQFNLHIKTEYDSDSRLLEEDLLDQPGPEGPVAGMSGRGLNPAPRSVGDPPRPKGRGFPLLDEINKCDYALINWFPQAGRTISTCGMETQEEAEPGAENTMLNPAIPRFLVKPYKAALQYGACFPDLNILIEYLSYATFRLQPSFVRLDDEEKFFHVDEVIGPSHKMMSSEVAPDGKHAYVKDWEFAVPRSQVGSLLKAIQEVLLENKVALPLKGIFIRFAQSQNQSLLSHVTSGGLFIEGEPVAIIEFPVFRPRAFSSELEEEYFGPYEELVHLILEKFHGRAHWGKNEDWIFSEKSQIDSFGDKFSRFRRVVHQLDPEGVFSNDFSKRLGI